MRARSWAEGGGLALLVLLPYFFRLLLPGNVAFYHHELPVRNLIFGILIDVAALCVLCTLALTAILRLSERGRLLAGAVLAAIVLWRGEVFVSLLMASSGSNLDSYGKGNSRHLVQLAQSWMPLSVYLAVILVLLFLLLAVAKPPMMRTIVQMTHIGIAGFAFSFFWIVPQLVHLAISPGETRVSAGEVHELRTASHPPEVRLVWILFDELSYRLVFEQRPAGQEFPNLQSLHDRSTSFANVDPVGFYTDRVIPSVFAGKEMDEIRSTATGELEYLEPRRRRWESFDPGASLFGLAERNGWNPGVVGWWNPYCRLLSSVVSECFWRPGIGIELGLEALGASADKSITANALVLPEHLLAKVWGKPANDSQQARERDIDDYRTIMERSKSLIQNEQIHFVFLHLPIPHPPGIYDRNSHHLRAGGNYLDNLTLADDTLGELMQEIGATADAERTTVIVSSDHSWRVPQWDTWAGWTREEDEISHRAFDARPVFLIHFPGQEKGMEVRSEVPELDEHEIIAAILNRKIGNEAQMAALLGAEKITIAGYSETRSAGGQ